MPEVRLRNLKDEAYKHVLKIQGEKKAAKGISKYSIEQTIYGIIEHHKQLTEKK